MDKTRIQERLTQLETEREQARATLAAYEGAIQDCKFWLAEIEKDTNSDKTDANGTEQPN
jgi:F0F1-type ATP synthase membrane subunit b/b'